MRTARLYWPELRKLGSETRRRLAFGMLILFALLGSPVRADLSRARAEPNLEKRSRLALQNAATVCQDARTAYEKGKNDQVAAAAAEIEESVQLAFDSLRATGKDPRRSPKWFKRAEIDTRNLLRKIDNLQQQMHFEDRRLLDSAKSTVERIHDDLLVGLLQGKKK